MGNKKSVKKTQSFVLVLGIIFVAFNLRPAITSVSPIINSIQGYFGINNLEAGLLTTIPLLAFAVFSPFVAGISRRLGNELTMQLPLYIRCM